MLLINAFFNTKFQLHYDESYYWAWGQNLSLSYFDHPPMIAYLIRLASIFGHSEFWVRFPGLISATITLFVLYRMALRMFNRQVAEVTMILGFSMPLIQATAFIITPDSPLLMFWILTLYTFYIGVFEQKTPYLYLAGFFAGCAFLSKYTALFIYPSLFLFLLTAKQYRYLLLKKDIYLAFILSIIIATPVILWNYQHDWVSFIYQFNHGIDVNGDINILQIGDYIGGQFFIAGPFIFGAVIYLLSKNFKQIFTTAKLLFLFYPVAFGYLFFLYCSVTKHIEANWPGPIYLSLIIFLAYYIVETNLRWVYKASFIFICIALVLTKLPTKLTPPILHNKIPGINIFFGNRELLGHVAQYIKPTTTVLACDYGNASRIWFYLGKRSYVLSQFPFSNSYRYWDQLQYPFKNAIYVCGGHDIIALERLGLYFQNIKLLNKFLFTNVITDNMVYVFQVSN
jgi:4-amino-4-deoxy-L-arabinose transferase-like glycosyltransferase